MLDRLHWLVLDVQPDAEQNEAHFVKIYTEAGVSSSAQRGLCIESITWGSHASAILNAMSMQDNAEHAGDSGRLLDAGLKACRSPAGQGQL